MRRPVYTGGVPAAGALRRGQPADQPNDHLQYRPLVHPPCHQGGRVSMLWQNLVIPLRPEPDATIRDAGLRVPYPMTPADWDQMMAVLNAMRPGLVPEAETPRDRVTKEDGTLESNLQ